MASGWDIHLTKQAGEYYVGAELCRRGYLAATFAGSVPEYDLMAANRAGKVVFVQVKTVARGDWQLSDLRRLVALNLSEDGIQTIVGLTSLPLPNLVWVFVRLHAANPPRFFIATATEVQRLAESLHRQYLEGREGRCASFHHAFRETHLVKAGYEDRWEVIDQVAALGG